MKKNILKYSIRVILTLVALYLIYKKVDLDKALYYLSNARWFYVVLAALSFIVSKAIAALRINTLYRTQGFQIPEILNLKLTFLGMYYNLFVPVVGGEGYKVYWLRKQYDLKVKPLLSSAVLDRGSGLAALGMLTVIFFMFSDYEIPHKSLAPALIPIIYVGYYLVNRYMFRSFLPAVFMSNFYSIFVQLLQVATTWFIILSLGIEDKVTEYLFTFLLSCYAMVLPMIAAREMAFVFGAEYLGLNPEMSLAISILFYLALAFASLLGAYYIFFPKRIIKQ